LARAAPLGIPSISSCEGGPDVEAERGDGDARRLRAQLDLDPEALPRWSALSPGQRKRWQVGASLAREPDVLLLDKPTNHIDAEARAELAALLCCGQGGAQQVAQRTGHRGHDGLTQLRIAVDPPGSHPSDVDHQAAWARHPQRLRHPVSLPPELRLSSGVLTCATCHDGASRAPHKLALSNDRSRLCLSCHP
jgi:predicted CXXCH cytochrome family protein